MENIDLTRNIVIAYYACLVERSFELRLEHHTFSSQFVVKKFNFLNFFFLHAHGWVEGCKPLDKVQASINKT